MNYLKNLLHKANQTSGSLMVYPRPKNRFNLPNHTEQPTPSVEDIYWPDSANARNNEEIKETHRKESQDYNAGSFIEEHESVADSVDQPREEIDQSPIIQQEIERKREINLSENDSERKDLGKSEVVNDVKERKSAKTENNQNQPNDASMKRFSQHSTGKITQPGLLSMPGFEHSVKNGAAPVKNQTNESHPKISVTIGTIEVKSISKKAPPPKSKQKPSGPQMTLQDYINKKKNNG